MKLKKGDEIIITLGKDSGRRGKIDHVDVKSDTVLVPGLNVFKRHMKRRDEKNPGGIVDFPRPLSPAKVALICPKCKKQTRVGYSLSGKEKHRVCKKCGQLI